MKILEDVKPLRGSTLSEKVMSSEIIVKVIEEQYENWDCSEEGFEGIRAQDILKLLNKNFYFKKFLAYGNLIDIFIDRNSNYLSVEDLNYLYNMLERDSNKIIDINHKSKYVNY